MTSERALNRQPAQRRLFDDPEKVLVFDLETQKSFQDVGGRDRMHELKLSLAVVYDYSLDQYRTYTEPEASALVDALLSASKVIGFNVKNFDYLVLRPYRPEVDFRKIPTLDLLEEVQKVLKFRLSLDSIASATLRRGKSAGGLDAIRWFREGRMDLIEKYCRDDVEITRQVYEHGRDHGQLKYHSRFGEILAFEVAWT